MTTEKVKRVKKKDPIVTFAECRENPGMLQFWTNSSFIHSQCWSCGGRTSYEETPIYDDYKEHYHFYEINIKRLPKEEFDDYWNRAEAEVKKNKEQYFVK